MTDKTSSPATDQQRCGFVSVIGAPNAGKSTLMNALVGSKVTIVSPKVQTTRTIVRGIMVHDNSQIIFVDTPGIFKAEKKLEKAMITAAWEGEAESDAVIVVVDASRKKYHDGTREILQTLREANHKKPVILVLNKIDAIQPETLLALSKELNAEYTFDATFMISALKEKGLDDLLDDIARRLPQGPFHYPEDQMSDMPMRLLAAEITREKLFHRFHQELPYNLTVETENWEEFDNGSAKVDQIVYVTKDGHRKIILGKGGQAIKSVGIEARKELADMLERDIHLKIHVKVDPRWIDDPDRYRIWGLDHNA